ncbi:MAG: PDZ domain-containing protein [Planctomycetota bacterium]
MSPRNELTGSDADVFAAPGYGRGPGAARSAESNERSAFERSAPEPATLGIEAIRVTSPIAGVQVANVLPDSKLRSAGIRAGDVLISMKGRRVLSVDDLAALLGESSPGDRVRVQVVRGRTAYDAVVTLGGTMVGQSNDGPSRQDAMAGTDRGGATDTRSLQNDLPGSDARNLQRQNVTGFSNVAGDDMLNAGVTFDDSRSRSRGLEVAAIKAGSLSQGAGIQEGDRVVSVDGRMLRDRSDWNSAIQKVAAGRSATVQLVRDDQLIEIVLSQKTSPLGEIARQERDAIQKQTERKSGSVVGGLGSMLGGLFGGSSSSAPESNSNVPKEEGLKEKTARSGPAPRSETGNDLGQDAPTESRSPDPSEADELAFGDDEPIAAEIFNAPPERDL